jgi:hypothetical protein
MKRWSFLIVISVAFGCNKNASIQNHSHDKDIIQNAQTYFEQTVAGQGNQNMRGSSPRSSISKQPDWQDAYTIQLSFGKAVLVPVEYQQLFFIKTNFGGQTIHPLSQLAKLLVYNDSKGAYHMQLVTSFPDSTSKIINQAPFTGILLAETWSGNPINKFKYEKSGKVLKYEANQDSPPLQKAIIPDKESTSLPIETCYVIMGYNYASSDPSGGYDWSESAGCDYSYDLDLSTGSDPTGADYNTIASSGYARVAPYTDNNNNIIDGSYLHFNFTGNPINLLAYLKCLNDISDAGASYSVTLCDDLAVNTNPGALLNSTYHPGHTFITLTKTNAGMSATVSFGLYPQNSLLSITSLPVASQISDDGAFKHEYNASISLSVSQSDFQELETQAVNAANSHSYILTTYNCTNYALDLFNSVSPNKITVPDWIGPYSGVNFGTTPNGLYQVLCNMQPGNSAISIGIMNAPFSSGPCQ